MNGGAELLFGQIAVKNGIVSPAALSKALTEQARRNLAGERISIGQVFVDLGILTADQVNQVLSLQRFVTMREEDKSFGRLAVINGFLEERQLQQCLDHQKLAWKGQRRVERIGEIMVRLGMLTTQQRDALLERQLRLKNAEATVVVPDGSGARSGPAGGPARPVEVILHRHEAPTDATRSAAETKSASSAAATRSPAPASGAKPAAPAPLPAKETPPAATRPAIPSVGASPSDTRPASPAAPPPRAGGPLPTPPPPARPVDDADDGPLICLRTCPFCQATTDGDRVRCIVCGRRSCVYCGMIADEEDARCTDCDARLLD